MTRERGKSMQKIIVLILAVIALCVLLAACDPPSQPPPVFPETLSEVLPETLSTIQRRQGVPMEQQGEQQNQQDDYPSYNDGGDTACFALDPWLLFDALFLRKIDGGEFAEEHIIESTIAIEEHADGSRTETEEMMYKWPQLDYVIVYTATITSTITVEGSLSTMRIDGPHEIMRYPDPAIED